MLRVAVVSPLPEELCRLIEAREPRLELLRDQQLLPQQRHAGDHLGDPAFLRTAEDQARFEAMIAVADVLYGIPDESPHELRRLVKSAPALRWVHTTPAGGGAQLREAALDVDDLDRIVFTHSGGVHAAPLAEFALLGVLAGLKNLPRLQAAQAAGQWGPRWASPTLASQTVVVVGLGGIGRATAERFAQLGSRVIGVHRRQLDLPGVSRIVPPEQFADVAAQADAVVMALPATPLTEKMLGLEVLAALKPGATVVNVGRGSTIDEDALLAALRDGRVGYAALDVFATEPLPASSAFWSLPNVLVSPHASALYPGEDRAIAELFADNATRLIDGRTLTNRVNTVEFY